MNRKELKDYMKSLGVFDLVEENSCQELIQLYLLPKKRVVVWYNFNVLLTQFTTDEIYWILAHEAGHIQYSHLARNEQITSKCFLSLDITDEEKEELLVHEFEADQYAADKFGSEVGVNVLKKIEKLFDFEETELVWNGRRQDQLTRCKKG